MEDKMSKKAVALKYHGGEKAPLVIAKGKEFIAHKIIETAQELGIPLAYAPQEAQELYQRDIGMEIPLELYQAVAEIYAFLLELDEELGEKNEG